MNQAIGFHSINLLEQHMYMILFFSWRNITTYKMLCNKKRCEDKVYMMVSQVNRYICMVGVEKGNVLQCSVMQCNCDFCVCSMIGSSFVVCLWSSVVCIIVLCIVHIVVLRGMHHTYFAMQLLFVVNTFVVLCCCIHSQVKYQSQH